MGVKRQAVGIHDLEPNLDLDLIYFLDKDLILSSDPDPTLLEQTIFGSQMDLNSDLAESCRSAKSNLEGPQFQFCNFFSALPQPILVSAILRKCGLQRIADAYLWSSHFSFSVSRSWRSFILQCISAYQG